jgi:diguanylate cyclase (GGDEF)-like protein
MLRNLPVLDRLSRWPRSRLWALFIGLTLLVGVADWASGERYTVYVLYFPIVALSAWLLGFRASVVFSFVSSILWIVDDVVSPPEPLPYLAKYWQASMRFIVFVAFANALVRLNKAMKHEFRLSHFDSLTGVSNRGALFSTGPRDLARCRRTGRPLTAIFIDLDDFKKVNDFQGHAEGDRVLQVVADCIRGTARKADLIARIGGDEFVVLAEMGFVPAEAFIARMLRNLRTAMTKGHWPVTFSIGAATYDFPPENVDELIKTADELMYTVKRSQKDSVRHELIRSVQPSDRSDSTPEFVAV